MSRHPLVISPAARDDLAEIHRCRWLHRHPRLVARVRSCNDGLTRPPEEGEGAVRYLPQVLVRMRLGGVSNRSLRPR
jgi:hypothetical protein